jgi:hypothetical protein
MKNSNNMMGAGIAIGAAMGTILNKKNSRKDEEK